MDVAQVIKHLFPNAEPLKDYTVMDNGEGSFIAEWNLTDPQPTESELQSVWDSIKDLPVTKPETIEDKLNLMQKAIDDLILGGV